MTRENVKKLKTEKRIGFVFSGLIIAFGALINLVIIVSNDEGGWLLPFLIALGIVGLSYFVAFSVNRKINKDLRVGKKEIKTEIVENKAHKIDYEVGSGVLYIPVLGDLFPKLWKPKMNEYSKYILTIKGVEQPQDASESLKEIVRTAEDRVTNPITADDFYLKGYAAHVDQNYDKAIEYYLKTLELDPSSADYIFNNIGTVYVGGKRDYDKAIEYYKKSIEIKPNPSAYFNMANAYQNYEQKYDKAIEYYKKAIELASNFSEAYCCIGNIYLNNKNECDKAIEYFKKAIDVKPDSAAAYSSMGNAYKIYKQEHDKAIECYKKAIEYDPYNLEANINMSINR